MDATTFAWAIAVVVGTVAAIAQFLDSVRQVTKARQKLAQAETKAAAEPEKAKPAWDLARATLESYFSRNLSQINSIFVVSIIVMFLGFAVVVWGILQGIQSPSTFVPTVVASAAGVITEFIGATFLFLYRSTLQQANRYLRTLERINAVGMAMQILDTMPDASKQDDLKSKTKANLIEQLMHMSAEVLEKSTDDKP